jgi:hypothetical protein
LGKKKPNFYFLFYIQWLIPTTVFPNPLDSKQQPYYNANLMPYLVIDLNQGVGANVWNRREKNLFGCLM